MMNKKRIIILSSLLIIFMSLLAGLFIVFRTDYVSEAARKLIVPALETFYDGKITLQQVKVNPIPFFVEIKEVEIFHHDNEKRLLRAERIRGFISLRELLSRKIKISPLSFQGVHIDTDIQDLISLYHQVTAHQFVSTPHKGFTVNFEEIELEDGQFFIIDRQLQRYVQADGVYIEARLKEIFEGTAKIEKGYITLPDFEVIPFNLFTQVRSDGKKSEIVSFSVKSSGSSAKIHGTYTHEHGALLQINTTVMVETMKKLFKLKEKSEGQVTLNGQIGVQNNAIEVDIDAQGGFFLETLKELFAINQLELKGKAGFNGKIKGVYPHIKADGTAHLENALFEFLPVQSVKGKFHYENSLLTFNDLSAQAYKGIIKGDASLSLINGDFHGKGKGVDVNSQEFFKSIQWESPFPEGVVKGDVFVDITSDEISVMGPDLTFITVSKPHKDKVPFVEKIKSARGKVSFNDFLVTIDSPHISTPDAEAALKGTVDLNKELVNLNASIESPDTAEMLTPYYKGLEGALSLKADITGSFDDPQISGTMTMLSGHVHTFPFERADSEFTFNNNTLDLKELTISQKDKSLYRIKGIIQPPDDGDFSSVEKFTYNLELDASGANVKNMLRAVSYDLPLKGMLDIQAKVKGQGYDFKGRSHVMVQGGEIYGQPIDSASFLADFNKDNLMLTSVKINNKIMSIKGRGELRFDGHYRVSLASEPISLKKLSFITGDFPLSGEVELRMDGSGTFKDPQMKLSLQTPQELSYEGKKIGKGTVEASLVNNTWQIEGQFLDGFVSLTGKGRALPEPDYDVTMNFKSHRYDFILPFIYQDIPDDVTVLMGGNVGIKGKGKDYKVTSRLNYLQLGLKMYHLVNRDDIVMDFDGNNVVIRSLAMSGRNGEFSASGNINLGQDYNVKVRGSINLDPLGSLLTGIKSFKGKSDFNLNLQGPWQKPSLKGTIKAYDTFVAPAKVPSLIGPINGEVSFSDDKFIIKPTEAAFGGGTIHLTGTGFLEGTQFKTFHGKVRLNNITLIPQEGLNIGFGGKLLLDLTPDSQLIGGNIIINHAKLDSRFDWKKAAMKKGGTSKEEKDSTLQKTHLNIQIRSDKKLSIENEVVKTHLNFKDLLVRGTPTHPIVLGTVKTHKGKIFFGGNIFDIINGRVDFINPVMPEPHFAIQAETQVREVTVHNASREYKIFLNIEGTPDDLTLSLSSDDATLTEKDMISLIALGNRGDSEVVTVGKRLIDNKLYIMYARPTETSKDTSSGSEDIVRVEYSLGKNISIVGKRDENDSVGGNLKFRFEF